MMVTYAAAAIILYAYYTPAALRGPSHGSMYVTLLATEL